MNMRDRTSTTNSISTKTTTTTQLRRRTASWQLWGILLLWSCILQEQRQQRCCCEGFTLGSLTRRKRVVALQALQTEEPETVSSSSTAPPTIWSMDKLLQTVGTEIEKIVPHYSDERRTEKEEFQQNDNAKDTADNNNEQNQQQLDAEAKKRRRQAAAMVLRKRQQRQRRAHNSDPRLYNNASKQSPRVVVSQSVLHNVIEEFIQQQQASEKSLSSFMERSMGILGEEQQPPVILQDQGWAVRVAHSNAMDDVAIANLRLSVFADFSTHQQSQFCARSCQALSTRRRRGATCVVATHDHDTSTIVASCEGSHHEFAGTQLGQRRPPHSIVYITEVAVASAARRRGLGTLLLRAMEVWSRQHGTVETLYLHVEVNNHAAIQLYQRMGYQQVNHDGMYQEFTKSLNLHPGASPQGRKHYLLYKDLVEEPTWLKEEDKESPPPRVLVNAFGFEIPA